MDFSQLANGASDDVYLGIWVNRSIGTVRGSTFTLNRSSGQIFVAFLALYVTTFGRAFWNLCRFFLHVWFSTDKTHDGVYHQRQAILRNINIAYETTIELLFASHVWRKRARAPLRRILPIAFIAAVVQIVFIAAGIFSSRFTNKSLAEGNQALVASQGCGELPSNETFRLNGINLDQNPALVTATTQNTINNLNHAVKCYQQANTSKLAECLIYSQVKLPYTTHSAAPCPFGEKLCKSNTKNIQFDTGNLDSVTHLGLNKGPRFRFRHQAHCAPLKTEGYTERYNATDSSKTEFIGYSYGKGSVEGGRANLSHIYATTAVKPPLQPMDLNRGNYVAVTIPSESLGPNFQFIPELKPTNSLISLVFLEKSGVVYLNESSDPWFGASKPESFDILEHRDVFVAEEPVSVLGCSTTRSYCHPATGSCFDWHTKDFQTQFRRIWSKQEDQEVLLPLFTLMSYADAGSLDYFYGSQGIPNMLARNTLFGAIQSAKLPDNWWQSEINFLFQASLAATQRVVVLYARGELWTRLVAGTAIERGKILCHSQKVRSLDHYSFSCLDIFVIITVGAVFIFLSTFLDNFVDLAPCIPFLRRNRKFMYARAEWQVNATLQLQRMAHENLGLGTWSRANEGVPVTEIGDRMGVLDISNTKHPRLVKPQGSGEGMLVEQWGTSVGGKS